MLSIRKSKNCWGDFSFFGFKNNKQYTEAYDCLSELIEHYPEYEEVEIH